MLNITLRFGDTIGPCLQYKMQTIGSDGQKLQMCPLRPDIL